MRRKRSSKGDRRTQATRDGKRPNAKRVHKRAAARPNTPPAERSAAGEPALRKGRQDGPPAPEKWPSAEPEVDPATAATNGGGEPSVDTERAPSREAPFPIVGIGSSAGGLEAVGQFLRSVPERSGMAFVVIQHLDPGDRGGFVDLLRRVTPMPVDQATDGVEVRPDHVYVIAPARDLAIQEGRLHLLPQALPRGLNLPVDFFFRSLAQDRQDRAIGVILSGMGSDGTLGLRAIKEKGGATFVQSLGSAKFDGMPRSALDAGLADVIAPASEMPSRIIAYHRHAAYLVGNPGETTEDRQTNALAKIFIVLRSQTGNDFSLYKRSTVTRRIERRMGLHQIARLIDYVRFLRENPKEVELLFQELLIGVTSFFRDPAAWDHLKTSVLPDLLEAHAQDGTIRAWVPGCSTGEEAYSLAMLLKEAIDERKNDAALSVQVFATDLDREAIERARHGVYPANIAADVTAERLRRFFVQDERGYRVSKDVRESVVFAPQNVVMDPPFTKLDLLSCRNLLIYLSPEVQKRLIPIFHYALNPGGILFLGSAETVGAFGGLFAPLDGKTRLYRRVDEAPSQAPAEIFATYRPVGRGPPAPAAQRGTPPPDGEGEPPAARASLQVLADRVIVQRFAPTAILVNDRGDVLYTSGRTGKYLEPAVGRASMNILAMARDGLRYELSAAFATALKEDGPVTVRGVRVGTNGGTQVVDLTLQRLVQPRDLRGTVMIVINDVATPLSPETHSARRPSVNSRVSALATELQRAHEELQSTREEMQTSQEELKSMNEELQSTNEELQSTNEELTTSKEEMQSMNEELQTVNHELQAKVDELSRSNNDMKNLLNSTEIATLFLDGELLIRRFTASTSKLIKLIPTDAGRPITDIASELQYPALVEDALEVLRSLVFKERQVATRDGRWFTVRILPYRTIDNVIDGVVITFSDVTATKATEERLAKEANELRLLTDSLPALVWCCRPDGACDFLSRRWAEYTGVAESEQLGHGWVEQVHPDDRDRVREGWRAAVRNGTPFETELRLRARDGSFRWFQSRAVPIENDKGVVLRWYGTHTDVQGLRGGETGAGGGDG